MLGSGQAASKGEYMPPSFDVLSYGTVGLDKIIRVPHLPRPDISTHALEESLHLGGKATNTAVFLSVWGVKVAVSGHTIGYDEMGDKLFEILAHYPNISTCYLRRQAGLRSMYCCILVTPDGERSIIGINAEGNPQTLPTAEMIGDARLLTLDLYGGMERVEAARLAYQAGLPVVVGDLRHVDHPILPYTTVAIASVAEIRRQYPGLLLQDFARLVQAVGVRQVILTDGPREVLVFDEEGDISAVTPPQVAVVDTTGAGDAFRAGVVYGILQGWELIESAALGAAAGSINVRRPGAATHPPALDEVQALAKSLPRRLITV
jgi:sugar/nucleoside kinase (ribokinase family)